MARFFHNHGLLTVMGHPQWYVVAGGSHTYVRRFMAQFTGRIHTDRPVDSISRNDQGVTLRDRDGDPQSFDRVIVATHADQALALLEDPSDEERRLLGAWRYSTNETYLHRDLGWMPTLPKAWASWNFIRQNRADARSPVTLTYYMNRLQRLATHTPYLVTLNPFRPMAPETVIAHMTYAHPIFDASSLAVQPRLPTLNGVRHTYYCGSYFGYGFHEDAARSGFQAAAALGGDHAF
jgi:predicted NAD/FAD-binding protein